MPDNDHRYLPDVFDFSRLFVACRSDELTAANPGVVPAGISAPTEGMSMLAAGLRDGVPAGGGAAITTVVTLGETVGPPAAAAPVVTAGPHGRPVTR